MDVQSRLQSHPLFQTFGPEALAEIVRAGTAVTYEPGDLCIRMGQPGEVFGVLLAGRLEAVRGEGTGQREHLGYVEAGECFGEMSLLTGEATSADVVAATRSEAVVFHQEAISPLLAASAEAVKFLTRLITSRLWPAAARPSQPVAGPPQYSLGAHCPMRLLTLNCRRSDVRYCYFETTSEHARTWGRVLGLGSAEALHVQQAEGHRRESRLPSATHEDAIRAVFAALTEGDLAVIDSPGDLSAIGHRVCQGGLRFDGPAVVDDAVKAEIARLAPLAPLANEYNLRGIEACDAVAASVPQVAVFDTSFHLKMPPAAWRYALPTDLAEDPELRRYGSHGISHEGAARAIGEHLRVGFTALRIITCHLGEGASVTAIDHGRSVANSTGLTPLSGLVAATRCGDLDPGLLLHLIVDREIPAAELSRRLYAEAGLLGLSGVSGDAEVILAAANQGDGESLRALQVYCRSARQRLSAYVGLLGGVDAIVFTGGIGRHCFGLRARICQGLDWMGIVLDEERNRAAEPRPGDVIEISQQQSRAGVFVVGSHEQNTVARKTVRALSQQRVTDLVRQKKRDIPIGISAHHVHLTQEHVEALFGAGHTLTWYADLTQPGQFACKEKVSLVGPKGRIERVRVLGPARPRSQVEIARTEEFKLGIDAPIRQSGDLDDTPGVTLAGSEGEVVLDEGVICAMRHIHMSPQDAMEFAVRDRDIVRICVPGSRSLVFGDVVVRVHTDFRLDMHIDTDEANAAELGSELVGYLDSIQQRSSR